MGRRPFVPDRLKLGPFTLEEALAAGLTRNQLESRCWRRLGPATYVWAALTTGPLLLLEAAALRLPRGAAFGGRTAGWLHGLELPPTDPIEICVPIETGITGRVGVRVRRMRTPDEDVTTLHDLPVTTVARTLADLAPRLSVSEGVVAVDAVLHLGSVSLDELERWIHEHPRRKGIRRLRRLVELAEPASESPMESRLRMLLVQSGLPRPEAQVELHDRSGRLLGRADLFYRRQRLVVEYDGATHRESLLEDNRRQNRILGDGYRLLRFAAGDVLRAPDSVVAEVRAALYRAA